MLLNNYHDSAYQEQGSSKMLADSSVQDVILLGGLYEAPAPGGTESTVKHDIPHMR